MISSLILKGSFWTLLLQWSNKTLGLISTIILARLLTPDDYGVVAISMILIHFAINITSAGTGQYLIRLKNLENADIQTGFTLMLAFRAVISLSIYYYSAALASFFDDQRLVAVFEIVALIPLIDAFKNIAVFLEERALRYKKIFLIGFFRKVLSFAVAIVLAFQSYGYMALIYAELVGVIFYVFLTFVALPFDLKHYKLSVSRFSHQFAFSGWSFLQSLVGFSKAKIDSILIGRYLDASDLGVYQLTSTLASLPSEQLVAPVSRPLYSGLSKYSSGATEQLSLFYKSLTMVSFVVCFFSFLLSAIAFELVSILLGDRWLAVVPLVSLIAASYAVASTTTITSKLMIAQAKMRQLFLSDILCLVLITVCLALALIDGDLARLSEVRVMSSFLIVFVSLLFVAFFCGVDIARALRCIFPSLIVSTLAYLATNALLENYDGQMVIISLMLKSIIFSGVFLVFISIWSMVNKFENDEHTCLSMLYEKSFKKILRGSDAR